MCVSVCAVFVISEHLVKGNVPWVLHYTFAFSSVGWGKNLRLVNTLFSNGLGVHNSSARHFLNFELLDLCIGSELKLFLVKSHSF